MQSYVPTKVKQRTPFDSLDDTLRRMTFNEIISNPDYHFKNSFVTNFDLIHHQCCGDPLEHDRKYYETIFYEKLTSEITAENRQTFISSAIKSERKDVYIEKEILKEHFNREEFEKNLQKKNVFLSAMKKNAFLKKKTDDCKSLVF